MITPDGVSGASINKSATTRFKNDQIKAKQSNMPFNEAAQHSLRSQTAPVRSKGNSLQSQPNELLGGMVPQVQEPVNFPTGDSGLPPEAAQGFDPAVFQEQQLDELVGNIRTQEFLNSPRVKDAASTVRLKNFFNATNPNKRPDPRNLYQQVLSRIGVK